MSAERSGRFGQAHAGSGQRSWGDGENRYCVACRRAAAGGACDSNGERRPDGRVRELEAGNMDWQRAHRHGDTLTGPQLLH